MAPRSLRFAAAALFVAACTSAQSQSSGRTTNDPFSEPIPASDGVIRVRFVEFAALPETGAPARMMLLSGEPGGRRLFVHDMRGTLYAISEDGKNVAAYVNIDDPKWAVRVQSQNNERGFQSFAFHPQFNERGTRGFGRFYTYTDTTNMDPAPDFTASGAAKATHDTVLLEWAAKTPGAATYDGGPPRELMRFRQPFANHNAGHLAFNPLAASGSSDYGLLYIGVADGGSGGDPLDLSQSLSSGFGKIFRIDPLGSNGTNGRYGIPAPNPYVADGNDATLAEIFASGVRNPQRFAWDPRNGNLFLADIGQNIVEEVSLVTVGANLGWNEWEGSFRFISRQAVSLENPRGDPAMTYPVVEYGQPDPLLQGSSAVTGVVVYRASQIPQLANVVLFGDNPSGEIFYFNADRLPNGGQEAIRRVLLDDNGTARTFLQVINQKRTASGRGPASRADLRFGTAPDGRVFLLNTQDNTIRLRVPDGR